MPKPRLTYQRIYQLLEVDGPLALPVIQEKLSDVSHRAIGEALAQARGLRDDEVRTMYVKEWQKQEGKGGRCSPVIAIGTQDDVPRLGPDRKAVQARYVQKPGIYERKLALCRNRRRNKKIAKTAANNVFRSMANPPSVKKLIKNHAMLPALRHELVDYEEVEAN